MIKEFNEVETRDSAVIYQSGLVQIKKLFAQDPVLAGELAICMCEVALTGQHSSDNMMIDIMLENLKVVSAKNKDRYDKQKEAKRDKYIRENKLTEIVEMLEAGSSQTEIAKKLGITKQAVSKKVRKIREEYPELLSTRTKNLVDDLSTESQPESTELVDSQPKIVDELSEDNDKLFVNQSTNLSTSQLNCQPESTKKSTSQPESTKILVDKEHNLAFVNQSTKVNQNVNVNVNDNVNVPLTSSKNSWGEFVF